jgi:hypothetical protein
MTKLMEKALSKINKLPVHEQDELAQIILDEIESEKQWDSKFAKSQSTLEKMAIQAITEHRSGKTRALKI